jgi:phosphonate metabolism protein PhnN/1,5-bisphosphokinase (PRPP-forming)
MNEHNLKASDVGPIPEPNGHLVMVVGQSGVGKDTMIAHARTALGDDAGICFVKRAVTRKANDNEDNTFVSPEAFTKAVESGVYALHWWSHGNGYGIPAEVREELRRGRVCVTNVSRSVLAAAADVAARRTVVEVSAGPEKIRERLHLRGRETAQDIADRVDRQVEVNPAGADHVVIRNDAMPEACGRAFARLLQHLEGLIREGHGR